MIDKNTKIPYAEIDEDIVDLCKALNSIDGIQTLFSCSGHGKKDAYVSCMAKNAKTYNKFVYTIIYSSPFTVEFFMSQVMFTNYDLNRIYFKIKIPCVVISKDNVTIDFSYIKLLTAKIKTLQSLFN